MPPLPSICSSRRGFLAGGVGAAAGVALPGCRLFTGRADSYSVSILGDTHYDAASRDLYHSKWRPRHANDARDRANEFARNAEMWRDRLPRLVASAAAARRADAAFLLQTGDLIQGDCSDTDTQRRMFEDAEKACRRGFEDLPFLTVCGNHDIRSTGGAAAFDSFSLPRAADLTGRRPATTTFFFRQGPDAFIVADFMRPDAAVLMSALDATEGARHTFLVCHGPVSPCDTWGPTGFCSAGRPMPRRDARFFIGFSHDARSCSAGTCTGCL